MVARKTPTNKDEAKLRTLGLAYPETTEDFPWDHRALKVRGKVFVFMGTGAEAGSKTEDFFFTVKLPESASIALNMPGVEPTGYGMAKSGWVTATYKPGKAPVDMLAEWLRESYLAVAPKKLAKLLTEDAVSKPKTKSKPKKKAAAKRKATA